MALRGGLVQGLAQLRHRFAQHLSGVSQFVLGVRKPFLVGGKRLCVGGQRTLHFFRLRPAETAPASDQRRRIQRIVNHLREHRQRTAEGLMVDTLQFVIR